MAANQEKFYQKHLTEFQIKMCKNAFEKVFDLNGNGILEKADAELLIEKWRGHSDISRDQKVYEGIEKVVNDILDSIKRVGGAHKILEDETDLDAYLNLRALAATKFEKLTDCPEYMQQVPRVFSKIIDQNDDEFISKEEYKRFYQDFCGIPEQELDAYTDKAYDAMTKGGTIKLDLERFTEIVEDHFCNPLEEGVGRYFIGFLG